jgi:hypothetical protein
MDNISLRLHVCNANKKTMPDKPEKPFVCKICAKAFKFDFSFEAHMNSHEGPVALSAYKKMQVKALEEKKKQVQIAAKRQLLSQAASSPAAVQQKVTDSDTTSQAASPVKDEEKVFSDTDVQNGTNLQEIVLEIVNVSELPKVGNTEGAEILAQGDDGDLPTTVPISDIMITSAESVPESCTSDLADVKPAENPVQSDNLDDDHDEDEDDEEDDDDVGLPPEEVEHLSEAGPKAEDDIKVEEDTASPNPNLFGGIVQNFEPAEDDPENKKPVKRPKRPLLYDYVMTEEKPFQCPECKKEFRWEISLNIHIQEHLGGSQSVQNSRNKNMKKKSTPSAAQVSSKIVYKRASSDDEDDYQEGDFSYGGMVVTQKRKRGRPRKEPYPEELPKRKRGRPPKDPYVRTDGRNETVIIKVTQGSGEDQSHIKSEKDANLADLQGDDPGSQFDIHIPKHRLIRFYLLRQLKLSRNRGFFPCRFCNKPFSCKASLNMHILRHTGKGSYRCSHCNQKFPDHRTLVLHRLIEEEDAMDSAYQCHTCCRACATSSGLMRHLQRHLAIVWPSSQPRAKVTGNALQS